MDLSIWTYPWDIADVGRDDFVREVRERAGVTSVSIAASYHAGHFLQPRSPKRKSYFPQDGTIYFEPNPTRWSEKTIVPLVADHVAEAGDMVDWLSRERDAGGLKLSCWTVCLHNTRLGMAHPEHVTQSAFGDANVFSLCPSSPAAADYVATLVADMTDQYRPDVVELETPGFMGFDHGYHHEKDGMGMTAEDEFLLSICFCPHCTKDAHAAGIDADAAAQTVRELIVAACNRAVPDAQFPQFPHKGIEAFSAQEALHAYLVWRIGQVTRLVARIRDGAHPDSEIVTITGPGGWREGIDDKAVSDAADGLLFSLYDQEPDAVANLIAASRATIGPKKRLVGALRVFYPEIASADALSARALAAQRAGCDGLNFYNYGLIPQPRLDWIGQACRLVREKAR